MRDDLYERVLDDLDPDLVVTANAGYEPVGVRDKNLEGLSVEAVLMETTRSSIKRLLEVANEVLLLEPLPIAPFHVLECLSAAVTVGDCAFTYDDSAPVEESLAFAYATIYRSMAIADSRVSSTPYDQLICVDGSPCIPIEDGIATMTDPHHVNEAHAVEKRNRIWTVLEPIMSRLSSES